MQAKQHFSTIKIIGFILMFALAVLCACSGETGRNSGGNGNNSGSNSNIGSNDNNKDNGKNRNNGNSNNKSKNKGQENVSTENAAQYVYSGVIMDFSEYGSDVSVLALAGTGNQIYALMEIKNWEDEPEDSTLKAKYSGYYQVFSCMADGSGKTVSKKIYLPDTDGYVSEMCLSDRGGVAALFYANTDATVSLLFWDGFREIQWEKKVISGGRLFSNGEGFVILARSGGGRRADYYDAQGELTESRELDGEYFDDLQDCFLLPDGHFLVTATDNEGKLYVGKYDPQTREGEKKSVPGIFAQYQIFGGTTADILFNGSDGVYQFDLGASAPVEILNFVDADLDTGGFGKVYQIDETQLAGVFYAGDIGSAVPETVQLGVFCRSEVPEGEQKQVVVLGTVRELDRNLRSRILSFNRTNSRYRITIKQYAAYGEKADAAAQLNRDILSGNMPDILLIDDSMPLQSYIAKDLLADVGQLMEEDGELEKGQFLENVMDAFRVKGILYYVIPSFSVDTLVAKQSKVGEKTGWNREEFAAVLEGLPDGTKMLSGTSRYDFLKNYMKVCGREYVDWEQGKCDFRSGEFVSMLEFAATLPEDAEGLDDAENSYGSQYREDKALLQPVTIRYLPALAQQIYGSIGEEIAYVGYPAESRKGSCIRISNMGFALSKQSENKKGAWEFARIFLTADFQRHKLYESEGSGLPVRRDVFGEQAQLASTQEGYCFINDEYFSLPPMTQAQIDKAVEFIEGLHNPAFEDAVIMRIMREEAESFLAGQKTAEEVAELIQNRVQLYLREGP